MGRKSARSLDAAEDSSHAGDSDHCETAAGGSPDVGSLDADEDSNHHEINAGGSGSSIGLRKRLRQGRKRERS